MKRTYYRLLLRIKDIDYCIDINNLPETMEKIDSNTVASYLTQEQYAAQLSNPDSLWKCPVTKEEGWFDDEWYENRL